MADDRLILIVEDEEHIAKGLEINLEAEGFRTMIAENGEIALAKIEIERPDLVLLDVMLPGISGFDVCDKVRATGNRVPILFVTARGREDDRVRGLELGGDDYITKPFSLAELIGRVHAIFRRQNWYQAVPVDDDYYSFGENKVDFSAYKAFTKKSEASLTQKECMILKLLVEREGQVVDRETILDKVWGYDRFPTTRTIDNLILNLRKIFEDNPRKPKHLHTQYGAGYRFTRLPETSG